MTVETFAYSSEEDEPAVLPIQMEPGYRAIFYGFGEGTCHVEIESDRKVPNSMFEDEDETIPEWRRRQREFPDGIENDVPAPTTDFEHAKVLVALRATSAFHEILEFTKLSGQRIAAPHPRGEDRFDHKVEYEMWNWLYAEMAKLVDTYVEKYPLIQTETAPTSPGETSSGA